MCELGMYRTPKFAEKLGSQEQDLSFVPVVMTLSVVFVSRRLGSRATVVCVEEACGRVYEHCCSTQSVSCQAHWDLGRPAGASPQGAQYPLIKEYTPSHNIKASIV